MLLRLGKIGLLVMFFQCLPTLCLAQINAHTQASHSTVPENTKVWIDVRTPKEFSQSHLTGAINIPYQQIATQINKVAPNKDTPIVLYCRSGRRAGIALKTLKAQGYTHLTNAKNEAGARALQAAE